MGKDETPESPTGRLVVGLLLAAIGLGLITSTDDTLGVVIGGIALVGAVFQIVVAANLSANRDKK